VLTNTSMMAIDTLPEHLVIAGGSYIGLEFAQMYRRFGSRVTVLEYGDRLIAREDPDVSREVAGDPRARRRRLPLLGEGRPGRRGGGRPRRPRRDRPGPAPAGEIEGSHLLAAVGRKPNTDDLGLDRAGIATTLAATSRSTRRCERTFPASGRSATPNGAARSRTPRSTTTRSSPTTCCTARTARSATAIGAYALFIDPPLGRVGLSEAEVRARGKPALVGVMPMRRVGRAKERGETQGFMKVLVDAESERLLGASLLCIEGDEIVHSLLDAMAAGVSYKVIERAVHIHPTVSELIPTLLGELVPLAP
jgi:pyruvate/2-oxoglutarate dehydrogenase complex dihydrolipoamide dehydrogenase (E3) component